MTGNDRLRADGKADQSGRQDQASVQKTDDTVKEAVKKATM